MIDSKYYKVVYNKKEKCFYDCCGNQMDTLTQAYLYMSGQPDKQILEEFDDDVKGHLEVWDVRVLIETV